MSRTMAGDGEDIPPTLKRENTGQVGIRYGEGANRRVGVDEYCRHESCTYVTP